jgi:Insect cuticle protein
MAFKVILVLAFAAVTSAGIIADYHHHQHEQPANYEFNYEVHDTHTGDIKRQQEVAKDGTIQGEYSLVEPDGLHRRVVSYTADDHHGFNAKVHREAWNGGNSGYSQPSYTKVIQPAITKVFAPATVTKVITPAVHAYPAHQSYAAPSYNSYNSHSYSSAPAHQSSHQYQSSHNSNNYNYHH